MIILVQPQKETQANIKFLNNSFQDFLHHPNEELLYITPTDAHEVNLIVSSLNSNKFTGVIAFQPKC